MKNRVYVAVIVVSGWLLTSTGLIIMFLFQGLSSETSHHVFYTLHPIHVVLSALVTASMYKLHNCRDKKGKCNPWILLVIGYVGSNIAKVMGEKVVHDDEEILQDLLE